MFKEKGHGFIRKSKAYGTIGVITLSGAVFLGSQNLVQADEITEETTAVTASSPDETPSELLPSENQPEIPVTTADETITEGEEVAPLTTEETSENTLALSDTPESSGEQTTATYELAADEVMQPDSTLPAELLPVSLVADANSPEIPTEDTPHLLAAQQTDELRPDAHLGVSDTFSNDVQTIVRNDSKNGWDIYYLHGLEWEHRFTTDFVNYTVPNSALLPNGGDPTNGWESTMTGSIITSDGSISGTKAGERVVYFSGAKQDTRKQTIFGAVSEDNGETFTRPLNDGNPLLTVDNAKNGFDFRDPYVFTKDGKYYMYTAEGNEFGVYTSANGVDWAPSTKIEANEFFHGRNFDGNAPVECPIVKTMVMPNGWIKQVFIFGAKDYSKDETTGTYYVVGHLDENGGFVAETDVERLDLGSDFYAINTDGSSNLDDINSSLTALGWIGNWNYLRDTTWNDDLPYHTIGAYSTPRTLTLDNDIKLRNDVLGSALQGMRTNEVGTYSLTASNPQGPAYIIGQDTNGDIHSFYDVPEQPAAQEFDISVSSPEGRIYLDIWQGGDKISLNYDPTTGWYQVTSYTDKLPTELANNYNKTYSGYVGTVSNFKVITDKTSVEFLFENGKSYTVARFANSNTQDFKLYSEDPINNKVIDMTVYNLANNNNLPVEKKQNEATPTPEETAQPEVSEPEAPVVPEEEAKTEEGSEPVTPTEPEEETEKTQDEQHQNTEEATQPKVSVPDVPEEETEKTQDEQHQNTEEATQPKVSVPDVPEEETEKTQDEQHQNTEEDAKPEESVPAAPTTPEEDAQQNQDEQPQKAEEGAKLEKSELAAPTEPEENAEKTQKEQPQNTEEAT
ncbi:hypothetical protein ACVR1G_06620 [Streptococcus dentasini]